ncbi:hypothetical protein O0L34_g12548 [Tuta absoluta]|nr:hypothetical protein O0L34_g12548 [Tuta absoluta]
MWYNVVMFAVVCTLTYLLKKILSSEPNNVQFQFKVFVYYFLTSFVGLILMPFLLMRPTDVRNARFATRILKHITRLYDLKWELRNGHILAEERGAVIVSNHQSAFDVLGQFNIWEVAGKMTVIAKKEIFYVWPFGLTAYLAGVVFIDRNNSKKAYKTLEKTSEVMVKNKTKIWLFPEGTRNKDFTKLLPFRKGAFLMAINAQVPIIPVLYSPYYFINRKKNIFNPGHVVINCLEPVPTKGLTADDVTDLTDRVYKLMQEEYMKLSQEVLEALSKDYPQTSIG